MLQRGDPYQLSATVTIPRSSQLYSHVCRMANATRESTVHKLYAMTFAALYKLPDNLSHFVLCILQEVFKSISRNLCCQAEAGRAEDALRSVLRKPLGPATGASAGNGGSLNFFPQVFWPQNTSLNPLIPCYGELG